MPEENSQKVLTKTAYEHLVAAVGKMLEEGEKAGQQAGITLVLYGGNLQALPMRPLNTRLKVNMRKTLGRSFC